MVCRIITCGQHIAGCAYGANTYREHVHVESGYMQTLLHALRAYTASHSITSTASLPSTSSCSLCRMLMSSLAEVHLSYVLQQQPCVLQHQPCILQHQSCVRQQELF